MNLILVLGSKLQFKVNTSFVCYCVRVIGWVASINVSNLNSKYLS